MMHFRSIFLLFSAIAISSCGITQNEVKTPVDYVNPYMGNISHLLVPTYPTIHLPNSILRVYPERADFTGDVIKGLPLIVTSHRGSSAFNLSPVQGNLSGLTPVTSFSYDNEVIKPYYYEVSLDQNQTEVRFAPSHQSAVYELTFTQDQPVFLVLNSKDGKMEVHGSAVSGFQNLENKTRVYLYLETKQVPKKQGVLKNSVIDEKSTVAEGKNACVVLGFGNKAQTIQLHYGISFISVEQARKNLIREIPGYEVDQVAKTGRDIWNEALNKIEIVDKNDKNKSLFYTSLYRCYERPVNISEDGHYYSAFDGKVHDDKGTPFFTDDWIWDTYRATHPLRVLIDPRSETNIIRSYILMAEQMGNNWMPTFPEITGDSRRMNSNHAVATVADAYLKGLTDFDLEEAYSVCKKGIQEKTLAPWSGKPAGWLDEFYKEKGYIPALANGEVETVPEVHPFEKRQPIAVTLGTSYDEFCLSQIAKTLKIKDDYDYFVQKATNYRNVFNPKTGFFHPKDKDGHFIEPFDYRFPGGMGAREYYGENNGWIYRWDVQHNVADLINLMGGRKAFNSALDSMFNEPLGRGKYAFFAQLPDHTGNVGQFSMSNEPSLHIPYLYNYSGEPWKTQKRLRMLLKQWFRDDLMGVPGDEDGGGMSAFVAFSMMGIYPVTPGIPAYNIGSPMFSHVKIHLACGKVLEIEAANASDENKYIQSATLNGQKWSKPWFEHSEIAKGGKLVFVMGNKANKTWGAAPDDAPPSLSKEILK
ncbi:MAG: GH92 family glycosyl hydrolase [Bacteroidales bacterium]|nr:GH92 family glycosyl hydrolase [Bacteroidales bacterium]